MPLQVNSRTSSHPLTSLETGHLEPSAADDPPFISSRTDAQSAFFGQAEFSVCLISCDETLGREEATVASGSKLVL